MSDWRIPFQSERSLQHRAAEFREQFEIAESEVVCPIENIVDVELGIDVVPLPHLHRITDSWGALSPDCSTIWVDEIFDAGGDEERYRFTLAHELAHFELHDDVFRGLEIASILDFKTVIGELLTDAEYRSMEYQADYFAGCVLVPENLLRRVFTDALGDIQDMRAEWEAVDVPEQTLYELALRQICEEAGDRFYVSPVCIDTRLHYTGLKADLADQLFGSQNNIQSDVHYRDLSGGT